MYINTYVYIYKVKSADTVDCSKGYCVKGGTEDTRNEDLSLRSKKDGPLEVY
jgi:hypothetical protein